MASTPILPPTALPDVLQELQNALASILIGFIMATTLYGISNVQTYMYYRNYVKDRIILKAMVGTLWVMDTLSTVLVSHSLYTYLVLNLGNILNDAVIPWSFGTEFGVVTLITFISQVFYAWQIWTVSAHKFFVGVILALAVASLATGLVTTVDLIKSTSSNVISEPRVLLLGSLTQGMAAGCDVLITTTLIYFLRSKRTGIKSTEIMIDKLILYGVSRGTLTAICQIMFLILLQGIPYKGASFWQPFHQISGKLYVNSVLASLNVRATLAGNNVITGSGLGVSGFTSPRSNTLASGRPAKTMVFESNADLESTFHTDATSRDYGSKSIPLENMP